MLSRMTGTTRAAVLADALESLDQVWQQIVARRAGLTQDEFLWEPVPGCLGQDADETRLALVLHAQHEVAHHGAEIALLRELDAARAPGD
jgi:uncharacterized damage-inducible protein DinB